MTISLTNLEREYLQSVVDNLDEASLPTLRRAFLIAALDGTWPSGGGGGGGAVDSVNGKTGVVVLAASDVGAATTAQGAQADTAVQPAGLTKAAVGLGLVNNTSDASKPVSTAQQTALNLKAPLASPAFTGTPTGITKAHVGLGNVANTADADKPVSTATATALAGKAGAGGGLTGVTVWNAVGDITSPVVGSIYFVKRA